MATTTPRTRYRIQINSKAAIVHLGSLDSFDRTEAGTQAARLLLDAAETGRLESAREAIRIYQRIVPTENFGGEYTALQWLAEYLTADREEQARLRTDRYAKNGIGWMDEKKMCDSVELVNTYMGVPTKVECKAVYTNEFLTKVELPKPAR